MRADCRSVGAGLITRLAGHLAQRMRTHALWRQVAVAENLLVTAIRAAFLLGGVDRRSLLIIRFNLATFDIPHPAAANDVGNVNSLDRIGVEHLQ